ncbi:unnamed protein product, partial [Rodentolepis nana]|uniref:Ubiquitinyl hydrolase 1 n=1 Tax=Rodentolepis nana TaxID=102285 RepID=A0A0R3T363_RODNA
RSNYVHITIVCYWIDIGVHNFFFEYFFYNLSCIIDAIEWPCPNCTSINAEEFSQCSTCGAPKPQASLCAIPSNNPYGYDRMNFLSSSAIRSRELNKLCHINSSQSGFYAIPSVAPYSSGLSNGRPQIFQGPIYYPNAMPINFYAPNGMHPILPTYLPNGSQPVLQFDPFKSALESSKNAQSPQSSITTPSTGSLLTWQMHSVLSRDIQIAIRGSLKEGNSTFSCRSIPPSRNFFIPAEVRSFLKPIQAKLLSGICDISAQKELEVTSKAINWWLNDTMPTSRLIALDNRANGDCLLDSLMQASFGVADSESVLRQTLAHSFKSCKNTLSRLWLENEKREASALGYELSERQALDDWESTSNAATSEYQPLEQIHIFLLCHIFRRPIVVYSVEFFISPATGTSLEMSKFQGIYLPFLWEKSSCSKVPLVVGYTSGHFSALVPITPPLSEAPSVPSQSSVKDDFICLPLHNINYTPMPVHFSESISTSASDSGVTTEDLISDWMLTCKTQDGRLWVKISHSPRNRLADEIFRLWLNACLSNTSTTDSPTEETSFEGIDVPYSANEVEQNEASPSAFGHDWDPTCMVMDETLFQIAELVKNYAVVYLVDIAQVPDFTKMYELYDPCTTMFFYRNKHIMVDLGTGNNNKVNWAIDNKQELLDLIESIYRGARKGRGLVVSPKDYSTKYRY